LSNETPSSPAFTLTETQRIEWLRLIRSEGVGPRTFRALLNRFGGAGAALQALPEIGQQNGRPITIYPLDQAEAEYRRMTRLGGRFVALGESGYPRLLSTIEAAPPLIAVRGSADVFDKPCVAVVGSRNASAVGMRIAENFGRDLGRAGFTLVSGLARGIDSRLHWASVETGTIGVMAGGLDKPYPPENLALIEAIIAKGGAIVSEMPLGWEPRGRDFPRRNRIISGLSYGVVVVEAAMRSGSLITARFAGEQGREVFAVPGSPLDPRSDGTNDLIRNGATLVMNAEHVIEGLSAALGRADWQPQVREELFADPDEPLWDEFDFFAEETVGQTAERVTHLPADPSRLMAAYELDETDQTDAPGTVQDKITRLMGPSPVSIDELVRSSGYHPRAVQLALVELEMTGRLVRHGGQLVSLS
jgi:DNA processing protein